MVRLTVAEGTVNYLCRDCCHENQRKLSDGAIRHTLVAQIENCRP